MERTWSRFSLINRSHKSPQNSQIWIQVTSASWQDKETVSFDFIVPFEPLLCKVQTIKSKPFIFWNTVQCNWMKVPVQTLSEDFQGSDALENSHGQITQWVDLIPLFGVSLFPYDIAFGWIIMKQFYFYEIVNFSGAGNVYSCPDCGSRYYHMALFVEFYSY